MRHQMIERRHHWAIFILDLSNQVLEGYSEMFLKWFKTKIILYKGGMRKIFAFINFGIYLMDQKHSGRILKST